MLVHAALFARSTSQTVLQAIVRIAPLNVLAALAILAGTIAGSTTEYVLFGAVFVEQWVVNVLLRREAGFEIAPAHFVERHGLVVIVAIGESIVAIGVAAEDLKLDATLVGVVVVGLALSACLWWTYFGGDDERAERALARTEDRERARLALLAFGLWHLLVLGGIIAVAAGLKDAVRHAGEPVDVAHALFLAGGVATYLAGDVLFRRALRLGASGPRALAALVALATVPVGTRATGGGQVAALVAVCLATFFYEDRFLRARAG